MASLQQLQQHLPNGRFPSDIPSMSQASNRWQKYISKPERRRWETDIYIKGYY